MMPRRTSKPPNVEARLRHVEQQLRGRQVPIVLEDPRLDREGQTWCLNRTSWPKPVQSYELNSYKASPGGVIECNNPEGNIRTLHGHYGGGEIPPLDSTWLDYWYSGMGSTSGMGRFIGHSGPLDAEDYDYDSVKSGWLRFAVSCPVGAVVTEAHIRLSSCHPTHQHIHAGSSAWIKLIDLDDCTETGTWPDDRLDWLVTDTDPYPSPDLPKFYLTYTEHSVEWPLEGVYENWEWVSSPDISQLLNAWLRRPGYVPGAKIGFMIDGGYETRWLYDGYDQQHFAYWGNNYHNEPSISYGVYSPRLDITTGGWFGPEIRCQVGGRKRAMLMEVQ